MREDPFLADLSRSSIARVVVITSILAIAISQPTLAQPERAGPGPTGRLWVELDHGQQTMKPSSRSLWTIADAAGQNRTVPDHPAIDPDRHASAELDVRDLIETVRRALRNENFVLRYVTEPSGIRIVEIILLPHHVPSISGRLITVRETALSLPEVRVVQGEAMDILERRDLPPSSTPAALSGFRVGNISPESLLHRIGLRPSDLIQEVNERPIATPEMLMLALLLLEVGQPVTIKVHRDGQEVLLRISQ